MMVGWWTEGCKHWFASEARSKLMEGLHVSGKAGIERVGWGGNRGRIAGRWMVVGQKIEKEYWEWYENEEERRVYCTWRWKRYILCNRVWDEGKGEGEERSIKSVG